ncbi:MAG: hypothetical protein UT84_C0002G0080 [Candidatus Curtissbacteria bacterium GW2011_GWA1_40_16]|uniref:Uncharacterized protein n=1 Tax=Candidatus Curtissbacteria bacterium GW2011_GWA1_40_16 TaxID=1618405 RepID=A0A0G0REV3_9BACT|nr:MAG: hypothetical protein UT84_C0002G0080 [Candidatus Curtissbacteria bacterium GW2011_GWA1_40_16]
MEPARVYPESNRRGFAQIFIVILLISIAALGVIIYLQFRPKSSTQKNNQIVETPYASQEECETKTGKACGFFMCDVVPAGKTFEETCGKGFKAGWKPKPQSPAPISTDETVYTDEGSANWKTYTRQGKYSFNYPQDWLLNNLPDTTHENQQDFDLESSDYKEGNYGLDQGALLVLYRSKAAKDTIEEMYEYDRFAGQDESTKTAMSVAGEKAIRYDYGYESTQATNTIFLHNGTYYWVSLRWANRQMKEKYLPVYDQILSTFKFTQ